MPKRILILGSGGQLGQSIFTLSKAFPDLTLLGVDFPTVDFQCPDTVASLIAQEKPEFCINCAAYTAVDRAEDEPEIAEKINATAVKVLAEQCLALGTTLIHISTDYVFDGNQVAAYTEEDATNPQSVYGRTKFQGEQHIQESGVKHLIFRTAWLYSPFANNFMNTMLRLGKERDQLTVVNDQIGTPTFAGDLASMILSWIHTGVEESQSGVYHYSNEGVASWYDFASAIMEYAQLSCKVLPISSEAFPQKASRPSFSLLNKKKIKEVMGVTIPHWRESLKGVLH